MMHELLFVYLFQKNCEYGPVFRNKVVSRTNSVFDLIYFNFYFERQHLRVNFIRSDQDRFLAINLCVFLYLFLFVSLSIAVCGQFVLVFLFTTFLNTKYSNMIKFNSSLDNTSLFVSDEVRVRWVPGLALGALRHPVLTTVLRQNHQPVLIRTPRTYWLLTLLNENYHLS